MQGDPYEQLEREKPIGISVAVVRGEAVDNEETGREEAIARGYLCLTYTTCSYTEKTIVCRTICGLTSIATTPST